MPKAAHHREGAAGPGANGGVNDTEFGAEEAPSETTEHRVSLVSLMTREVTSQISRVMGSFVGHARTQVETMITVEELQAVEPHLEQGSGKLVLISVAIVAGFLVLQGVITCVGWAVIASLAAIHWSDDGAKLDPLIYLALFPFIHMAATLLAGLPLCASVKANF